MQTAGWIQEQVVGGLKTVKRHVRQNGLARRFVEDLDILKKYGRWRPERTAMLNSPNYIHVNASEPRGRALLRSYCDGQPQLKTMWCRLIGQLSPELVLDCGANYGEFLFMPRYQEHTKIFGVEPAPELKNYLEKSHNDHCNRDQISMHYSAAGDVAGKEISFYYDQTWSGRSSPLKKPNLKKSVEVKVEQTTVDCILKDHLFGKPRLVFKIDVESYEPKVMRGMQKTLEICESAGLVEFDSTMLLILGQNPTEFFESLSSRFLMWAYQPGFSFKPIKTLDELDRPGKHVDFLLFSSAQMAEEMGLKSK